MSPRLKGVGLVALVVLTLVSFAPLVGLLVSIAVANALGCPLDEGSVHACLVAGTDIGGALGMGFVLGWLMIVTWPGMLACLVAWPVLVVLRLAKRGKPA